MSTELWIRNPVTCIRECAELLHPLIVWDRGFCVKQRIDPQKHIELHYPVEIDYRLLLVGEQGAAELRRGRGMKNPYAVYPVWVYGEQMIPDLEELMASQHLPKGRRPDERGVPGQDHVVVLTNFPRVNTALGKALIRTLIELQEDYPDCKLHIHGLYGWKEMFAHGWHAVDFDPVSLARRGEVFLGSGKKMKWENTSEYGAWVAAVGFTMGQLSSPQERIKFNIKSAEWAAEKFTSAERFRARNDGKRVDYKSPDAMFKPSETKRARSPRAKAQEGDKLLCDTCSLAPTCKFYREGAVCAIPDTDGASLASHFGTRDADQIINGLGNVLKRNVERFEKGVDDEERTGELDPEVTRIGNSVFTMGVKLAKLIDPSLNQPGIQLNVGVQNNAMRIESAKLENTPAQIMSAVVAELQEKHGIPLEAITPAMVAEYLVAQQREEVEKLTAIETTAS